MALKLERAGVGDDTLFGCVRIGKSKRAREVMFASMFASTVANIVAKCTFALLYDRSLGVDSSALSSLAALAMTSASHGTLITFCVLARAWYTCPSSWMFARVSLSQTSKRRR
jgi:hypothetical protein